MFPLCNTCAHQNNTEECNHTDKQRQLSGTWCAKELKRAVEVGYKVEYVSLLFDV